MRPVFLLVLILGFHFSMAQPFIDLASIRYQGSPDAGLIRRNKLDNRFDYLNAGINLPFVFKKDSSLLVFSPFAERWHIGLHSAVDLPDHFQGLALPVAFIKPINAKWKLTLTVIPRWNGYDNKWLSSNFQLGGAVLASLKRNQRLTWKFGIYYNSELSGPFIIPLLGVDWRLDARNNIYGVLPGNLVWEHKAGKGFYIGATFRAVTNSYQAGFLNNRRYFIRIDDNQLSLYSDIHITRKMVFNIEAGHSVLRQLRMGYNNGPGKYFFKEKVNDNLLIKAGLAYRLRL